MSAPVSHPPKAGFGGPALKLVQPRPKHRCAIAVRLAGEALPLEMPVLESATLAFQDPGILSHLLDAPDAALDALTFGVIGFDGDGVVRRYNAWESQAAGLSPQRVVGHPLFTVVAPCMNNFMVAQRFEDAAAAGESLDTTIDYVLTLRMRPVKVKLRLLAAPGRPMRFVLVDWPR